MGCQGKEIDYQDLRTPEQKAAMQAIWAALQPNIGQGATPFGGQRNMPFDQAQMAAMATMMGAGGYPSYQPGNYPLQGMGTPMGAPAPFNQQGFQNMQGAVQQGGQEQFQDDPYNPWHWRHDPGKIENIRPWGRRRPTR